MSFIQSPPQLENQYTSDRVLKQYMQRFAPENVLRDIEPSLQEMGDLAANELFMLAREYRLAQPVHEPFDAWGNRVDKISLTPAWQHFARVAASKGLVATAYERRHGALSRLHQFALVYLFDRSTQVYTCPLAMTDGCARTLEITDNSAINDRILPHLISRSPDNAWSSGQWMTERTGGSDVGLSETVARHTSSGWQLYGTKWFTSAVSSQVALTLARPEGNPQGGKGLALFLVEVRDANGNLNGITVNRLKEKLGTKQVPTAELTLDGCKAIPLAGLSDGVRHMANMLNITRTWNAVCAVAGMRRGLALARDYASRRFAFGALLKQKPLHLETLADLAAEYEAAFQLVFHNVRLMGREECDGIDHRETAMLRLLQPVAKLLTAKQAVASCSEVLECFGGAGYVEDTGLPELLRDAQVLPIWEGTTNVLSLEVLRCLRRDQALPPTLAYIRELTKNISAPELRQPVETVRRSCETLEHFWSTHAETNQLVEIYARRFAMTIGRTMSLALLCDSAQWNLSAHGDRRSILAAQRFAARGVDSLGEVPAAQPTQHLDLSLLAMDE